MAEPSPRRNSIEIFLLLGIIRDRRDHLGEQADERSLVFAPRGLEKTSDAVLAGSPPPRGLATRLAVISKPTSVEHFSEVRRVCHRHGIFSKLEIPLIV
jgi:hypothetical protein